ncbi:MAG: hypothetical protein OEM24_01835 [Paracoccaceae bacterium]|nr:hypothetical protein [Paracoccaceae bacterium]
MSTASAAGQRPGVLGRAFGALKTLLLGTLLSLTPLTSILVLGWLTRRMQATIEGRLSRAPQPAPGWLLGPRGEGAVVRLLGGLGANIRAGFATAGALLGLTLPFTALWLGAWWAGWENSFNKGYEQAAVGPSVFLLGTALALPLMAFLPLALAHAAAEGRAAAVFEARRLRAVATHAGWRLPALGLLTLALALPLFAARGLPAFAGAMLPGLEDLPPAEVEALKGRVALGQAAYAFTALLVLRGLGARLYARAASAAAGADPALWARSRARLAARFAAPPSRPARTLWLVLALAPGLGLSFLILAGQFLNYGWWHWLTHPFLLLPWPG